LNVAAELELVGIVEQEETICGCELLVWVRQMGKFEGVRGFMIGTWMTLNPEFGPEVYRGSLIKFFWDLFR
jgi:hypothetical protein